MVKTHVAGDGERAHVRGAWFRFLDVCGTGVWS